MAQFFSYDYHGAPFVLFGTWHIVALLVISLINIAILGFRKAAEKKSPGHPLEHGCSNLLM